jgi:hypothetical protein
MVSAFFNFAFAAIDIACRDALCGSKLFANNNKIGNTITIQRGMGISITTLGLAEGKDAPLLSDITFQDTVINGNTIATKMSTMYINAGVGGGDRNQIINLTISGNHLSSDAEVVVGFIVADVDSTYFGVPGPADFSEYNLIDHVTIADNVIEAPYGFGIGIGGANYGNSYNLLRNTKILNNTLTNIKLTGISLDAGGGGSKDRTTDNNGIEGVEVRGNTIAQTWVGIAIAGPSNGASNNHVNNVIIADNAISEYTGSGILLIGGDSSSAEVSDNLMDGIIISGNNLQQNSNQGSGVLVLMSKEEVVAEVFHVGI